LPEDKNISKGENSLNLVTLERASAWEGKNEAEKMADGETD
jgi:hypothetical protein